MSLPIHALPAGLGELALAPLPGRGGFDAELADLVAWGPAAVVSMTTEAELRRCGAGALGARLAEAGIAWHHLPIPDFGAPGAEVTAAWPAVSADLRRHLSDGKRVVIHCYGGCGRSGMAALRLMVEMGEPGQGALHRLRQTRPCAVETDAQMDWALAG